MGLGLLRKVEAGRRPDGIAAGLRGRSAMTSDFPVGKHASLPGEASRSREIVADESENFGDFESIGTGPVPEGIGPLPTPAPRWLLPLAVVGLFAVATFAALLYLAPARDAVPADREAAAAGGRGDREATSLADRLPQDPVRERIDSATTDIDRENPPKPEQENALLRAVRPDLAPPAAPPSATAPPEVPDATQESGEMPVAPATEDRPPPPKEGNDARQASRTPPDAEASGPAHRSDGDGKIAEPKEEEVARPARRRRIEDRATRAIRQAGIRHNVRRARAAMERADAPSFAAPGPLALPESLKPTRPPAF